jgi:hypothetical protein
MYEILATSGSYNEFGMYSLSCSHRPSSSYSVYGHAQHEKLSMVSAWQGYRRMRSSSLDLKALSGSGMEAYIGA